VVIKYAETLNKKLLEDEIIVKRPPIKATYSGFFTLPPFRRNEVILSIDWMN